MNIPFDIVKGKGPIIFNPLRTADDVDQVREFVPEDSVPYVGEALTILRKEVRLSVLLLLSSVLLNLYIIQLCTQCQLFLWHNYTMEGIYTNSQIVPYMR